mmetsp:Transcript_57557/g.115568  ORF Transcript_57557/g.115568 Transcript_57557/m.115568 type:complete len:92 (-) Transcript_57557:56-331(-)
MTSDLVSPQTSGSRLVSTKEEPKTPELAPFTLLVPELSELNASRMPSKSSSVIENFLGQQSQSVSCFDDAQPAPGFAIGTICGHTSVSSVW